MDAEEFALNKFGPRNAGRHFTCGMASPQSSSGINLAPDSVANCSAHLEVGPPSAVFAAQDPAKSGWVTAEQWARAMAETLGLKLPWSRLLRLMVAPANRRPRLGAASSPRQNVFAPGLEEVCLPLAASLFSYLLCCPNTNCTTAGALDRVPPAL